MEKEIKNVDIYTNINIKYKSTKKEKGFVIKHFNENEISLETLAEEISTFAVVNDPIIVYFKFSQKEFFNVILNYLKKFVNKGLGVLAFEESTEKLAGVILLSDLFYNDIFEIQTENEQFNKFIKWLQSEFKILKVTTCNSLEKLLINYCFVKEEFQSLGLITKMISFLNENHLLLTSSKIIYSFCYSTPLYISLTKHSFHELNQYEFEEVENNGESILDNIENDLLDKQVVFKDNISLMILDKTKKSIFNKFIKESEYIDLLDNDVGVIPFEETKYEYKGQKTKFGEVINSEDIKKRDIINYSNQPCIVKDLVLSKKEVWIFATDIIDCKSIDIVYSLNQLVELLNYKLVNYYVKDIIDAYAVLEIVQENDEYEKNIKLPMPSSNLEIPLFNTINEKFLQKTNVIVEVIHILNKRKITRIIYN